jgi:two-component system sensor histidine kinase TctE
MPERWLRWPVGGIRQRLLLALLLPLAVIMLATLPLDFRVASEPALQAYDEMLFNDARALLDQVQLVDGQPTLSLNPQAERILRSDHELYVLHDELGQHLAGDRELPAPQAPPHTDTPVFRPCALQLGPDRQVQARCVTLSRQFGRHQVLAQVAETLNRQASASRRIMAAMVLPNLLVALVGSLVLYAAARIVLSPLEQVARQIGQRTPNDLRAIQLPGAPSEISDVINELNRLLERVQEAGAVRQRFHANVAHQLRTPLTGLRTQVELAQMDGCFTGHEERFQQITGAVDRLIHLIAQLLTLSRAEAGPDQLASFVAIELPTLLADQVARHIEQAMARDIDLGCQLEATASIRGVPVLIAEVVNNLVDNALRYCPPGSVVTVCCEDHGARVRLAVEDNGPGIASDQRDKVFHRFHRGSSNAAEGSGLGLAIVQEIAQLHGAQVRAVTPLQGQGARIEVDFPRA